VDRVDAAVGCRRADRENRPELLSVAQMVLPPSPLRTARYRAPVRCGDAAGKPVTCWRGAAQLALKTLVVLVVALPSSAATGAAAASPPPPADMGLLVARLERLEAEVWEHARETREARADTWAL
jgi:hypothetical protein